MTGSRRKARRDPPRRKEVASAGALIAETLAAYGLTDELRAHRVLAEWEALVGPRIAARAEPIGVVRRVLRIRVSSSAWMHELGLLKAALLRSLWDALGEPRVFDDLAFELAGRDRTPKVVRPLPRPRPSPARAPVSAPPAAAAEILDETSAVDDPDLRELIARVRVRHNR